MQNKWINNVAVNLESHTYYSSFVLRTSHIVFADFSASTLAVTALTLAINMIKTSSIVFTILS